MKLNTENIVWILREEIGLAVKLDPHSIDQNLAFLRLGISSIDSLKIINRIKRKLQIDINPVAMFEHKTIIDLAAYLHQCMQEEAVEYE